MKHIVRKPIASGFGASPAFTGTLRLSHRGSDTQFELPLTIDANGVGQTDWTAPSGAPMGRLRPASRHQGRQHDLHQPVVQDRRIPPADDEGERIGAQEAAIRPTTMPLDLFVGYLSGGGASNLPVELRVGYFAGDRTPDGYDSYTFGGKAIAEGVKPMNGNGDEDEESDNLPPTQMLPVTLSADGSARTSIDVPQSLVDGASMMVEMDYQDANGEVLTASRRIALYPRRLQLGMKTDGWLMKNDDLRLRFVALDTRRKPLANQAIRGRALQPRHPHRAAPADRRLLRL
jgi:hypothetical protein